MRKILITGIVFMTSCIFAFSQKKDETSIGFRLGPSYGITYKHFISKTESIEGLLTSKWTALLVTGLYERHTHAFDQRDLFWFYGAGAHAGSSYLSSNRHFNNYNTNLVLGIDGVIGMVYYLDDIPFNVSMEWKPMINLLGADIFWPEEIAISVRYIIQ